MSPALPHAVYYYHDSDGGCLLVQDSHPSSSELRRSGVAVAPAAVVQATSSSGLGPVVRGGHPAHAQPQDG